MKSLAHHVQRPAALAALDRALAPNGSSELDPRVPAAIWRRALSGPAAEFLARPGKQLRAALVNAGWVLGGAKPEAMPEELPLVIELLHAGSLVIDDIEDGALDRRGAPALHHVVGVPLAINTGSWMYFWALAELAALELPPDGERVAYRLAITTLVRCHQGQALDLAVRVEDLAVGDVQSVVAATTRLKTGMLCRFAAELGALAAGAPTDVREVVGQFGEEIGGALQMLDDLGSLGSPTRRAKAHEDLREGRPTWPWAWLAEASPFAWSRLSAQARAAAGDEAALDDLAIALHAAIYTTGRSRVRAALDTALAGLAGVDRAGAVLTLLASELARMEASYG